MWVPGTCGPLLAARTKDLSAPESWVARLREISPIVPYTSHLRFRWLPSSERWALYQCVPLTLLPADRWEQLQVHWSDLPPSQQMGRRVMVSDYQFYMAHDFGVDARKFWVLQGEEGGTPARYSDLERKILHAQDLSTDVPKAGSLPYAPFDERVVAAVLQRDRLVQVEGQVERLRGLDTNEAQKAAEEAMEKQFRRQFLDWYKQQMQPEAEFLKTYLRTKEATRTMRRATKAEANAVSQYRDHYIEHGSMPAVR